MRSDLDNLIVRLKQNDKNAFNALFYMYADKLYKFGLSYFHDHAEAEEVVQEVFLKIWLNRNTITDASTINAYIFTIAKNLIFNNLKKKVHDEKYRLYYQEKLEEVNSIDDRVNYNDTEQIIKDAINQLPKKRKLVFLLSRKVGLKNKEIARRLNISIKTVETHMTLSLKHLKEALYLKSDKILLISLAVHFFLR